ncbi:MAG: coproporphyrinogen-III oxidase family protein [Anaerostipes sp.]|jgi:coproporphyrinogen III oxidase-like Fe-S oxidoreductase
MSIITTTTRMWLTKSFRPFRFTNEYDSKFSYDDCKNLGLYVHIPFCRSICSFCPYCKEIYDKDNCNKYIDHLIKEIKMVGENQKEKRKVTSLYFGGGSPALAVDRLDDIIETIKKYFIITEGIGIELHPYDITIPTLQRLNDAGITKISIGIQSLNEKFLGILGRNNFDMKNIEESLNAVAFETVSMDFIFALPDQTIDDLKADIDTAFKIGANHIAIYPFIDFTFTNSTIKPMNKKEKRKLLDDITIYCKNKGYVRNSIWTFAKNGNEKYSSMTRDNFLGFGCSATTLLKEQFKINTFSVNEYCKRIDENKLATSLTIKFTLRQRMLYYLFWTAYSTKVREDDFEKFFGVPLKKVYGFELWAAKIFRFITENHGIYAMTFKGAFYYHYYENFYTLSYIDKMWENMRKEAFPKELSF